DFLVGMGGIFEEKVEGRTPPPPTSPVPPEPSQEGKVHPSFNQQGVISEAVRNLLGRSNWEVMNTPIEEKFFSLTTNTWEPAEYFQGRRRVWEWCVRSIQGGDKPLPYAHLLSRIDKYDLTH